MKTKITYLLLILPLLTFAQGPWNFDTSTEGFTCNSSGGNQGPHTVTQTGGDLRVGFVDLTNPLDPLALSGNNPIIRKADAGINADTNINFIEIRLKNLSAISYLRFCPATTTANYGNVQITTGDTDYKTYVIDVTGWTGPAVGIDILCKKFTGSNAGGAYTPVSGEYILIDYIKPLANAITPGVNVFNFDANAEGFDKLTRATAVQATESTKGTLKVTYLSGTNNALAAVVGLNSTIAHVEGSNKYAHITLKNTTTNNQFQLKGKVATATTAFSPSQTFTVSDADYKTYDFDLSTWDSGYQFPELNVAVKDTWSAAPTTYAINDIVVVSNTYYKSLTGNNTAVDAAALKLDTTNWVLCNATGEVAPAVGAVIGGALDMTNSIYIDSIVFDNTAPVIPEVNVFNFNATAEGFDKTTRASAVPATESGKGTLQVKYVSGTNNALAAVVALNSSIAHVEGSNKYAHITLKNTTTNNQFQLKGKAATLTTAFSPSQTFTVSDADYKTYDFDLSTWDSGYQFPELAFAVKDTWSAAPTTYAINDIVVVSNTYYKSLTGNNTAVDAAALKLDTTNWVLCNATGEVAPAVGAFVGSLLDLTNSVYIDSIVFDNTAPALGTTDFGYANNTISLYPNPANDVLNVSSSNKISKIEVYDLLGRKVASKNNASDVNVAALGKGAYIVKVVKENGSVVAKRFIKQ
jgi:hypothetical protein